MHQGTLLRISHAAGKTWMKFTRFRKLLKEAHHTQGIFYGNLHATGSVCLQFTSLIEDSFEFHTFYENLVLLSQASENFFRCCTSFRKKCTNSTCLSIFCVNLISFRKNFRNSTWFRENLFDFYRLQGVFVWTLLASAKLCMIFTCIRDFL